MWQKSQPGDLLCKTKSQVFFCFVLAAPCNPSRLQTYASCFAAELFSVLLRVYHEHRLCNFSTSYMSCRMSCRMPMLGGHTATPWLRPRTCNGPDLIVEKTHVVCSIPLGCCSQAVTANPSLKPPQPPGQPQDPQDPQEPHEPQEPYQATGATSHRSHIKPQEPHQA